jgi:hypothetical protein
VASDSKISVRVVGLPCVTRNIDGTTDRLALNSRQIRTDTARNGTYIQFLLESGQMVLENAYDFGSRCLSAWNFDTLCGTRGNIYHFFEFRVLKSLYGLISVC